MSEDKSPAKKAAPKKRKTPVTGNEVSEFDGGTKRVDYQKKD